MTQRRQASIQGVGGGGGGVEGGSGESGGCAVGITLYAVNVFL